MRCCAGDEGFVALRSRPAEGGSKPPSAALAEDCCGERRGKRRRKRRQVGIRKTNAVEVSKAKQMASKPGCSPHPGMSLAGVRLLARWRPARR